MMENQKNEEQKVIAQLNLTENGAKAIMHLLDIARRQGNRQDATLALNFMNVVEKNIQAVEQANNAVESVEQVVEEKLEEEKVE